MRRGIGADLPLVWRQVLESSHEVPACVPQLIREVSVRLELGCRERHVLAGRDSGDQREAKRVGTDVADRLDRVDDVALGLRHLRALLVAHEAVEVDRMKRRLASELETHHDHPSHPEEENIIPGLHHR